MSVNKYWDTEKNYWQFMRKDLVMCQGYGLLVEDMRTESMLLGFALLLLKIEWIFKKSCEKKA